MGYAVWYEFFDLSLASVAMIGSVRVAKSLRSCDEYSTVSKALTL